MQYALLIYNPDDDVADQAQRPIDPGIAAVLGRPDVTGWIRLHAPGSATTVSHQEDRTLLTDGPFIDSKEFLGGLVLVEADNLDGALAVAAELAEHAAGPRCGDRGASRPRRGNQWRLTPSFATSGAGCSRHWSDSWVLVAEDMRILRETLVSVLNRRMTSRWSPRWRPP